MVPSSTVSPPVAVGVPLIVTAPVKVLPTEKIALSVVANVVAVPTVSEVCQSEAVLLAVPAPPFHHLFAA